MKADLASPMEDLEKRFALSPLIDAEIDVGGLGLVALHPEVDHDLRLKVTAAVIAHHQGYSSADYVYKRHLSGVAVHKSRDQVIREAVVDYSTAFDKFYRSFPPRDSERIGVFAFDLAFVRSHESIKLLLSTARQGFLIEPCLIARSLIEQFAYAVAVCSSDEDDVVFKTMPQRSISKLKEVQASAGKAYGLLSELSHYNPNLHFSFIGEEDGSQVLQRCYSFKLISLGWVFYILDLQFRVFRHCYHQHPSFGLVEALEGRAAADFDEFFDGAPAEVNAFIRELF
ncbi:hypothetical protein [Qipengyuania flava]|uniref:hypothetical protein n=1 Tax=Qipengyuania flava TaxID=192812 RepID=UPI001C62F01E|nr:hypothetical protein [Qipengyuania flava]QYJ07559.1 hypothetical protein KUV82_02210 [Qipengyuania flava]